MTTRSFLFRIGAGTLMLAMVFSYVPAPQKARADTLTPAQRAALQAQYDELQIEIAAQQKILDDTQAKKKTLSGNVTLLNAQIKQAQAQIAQKTIAIKELGSEIQSKTATISKLSDRIAAGKESLAGMLRQQNQLDKSSVVEVAFGEQSLSSFFADLDSFVSIERNMQVLFSNIQAAKSETEVQRQQLANKQNAEQDAKYTVQTKQAQIAANKTEQQKLLAITSNQATQYQKVIAANKAKAAQIRAALFALRDAAAIPFGDALSYAKAAQAKTGVDPAFILAVLTQESNLGANVGQCYLTNDSTGAGVGKNSGKAFAKVMSPTRDVPPFLSLASDLGFDPHKQVVSCPQSIGWGGAMGPAQFIPSTWAVYAKRIAATSGDSVANPWDPKDAIAAMSLYLADLGADAGGYSAEHTAAAKYYAGGGWATAGQSYANSVMSRATQIQSNIDFLTNNS